MNRGRAIEIHLNRSLRGLRSSNWGISAGELVAFAGVICQNGRAGRKSGTGALAAALVRGDSDMAFALDEQGSVEKDLGDAGKGFLEAFLENEIEE